MSHLLVGGDWACTWGDFGTLAHNAELLAICLAEPLSRELLEVARCCRDDLEHAMDRWYEARGHLRDVLDTPDPALHPSG